MIPCITPHPHPASMPSWHGEGGGGEFPLFSLSAFGVARFFMALCVFFCHVFEPFNYFGFLFVSVFFFMSGYGMEFSHKRSKSLIRCVPYLLYFISFSVLYFSFFRVFIYPSSWFLVVYFVLMLLYRLSSNLYVLLISFVGLAFFFYLLDFNWAWSASYWAFFIGIFIARFPRLFTLKNSLLFFPFVLLLPYLGGSAMIAFLPFFIWLVLNFSSIKFFSCFSFFGRYSFHFYCIHCFFLGLFGVTWTLGGSPEFWGVLLAFSLSVFFSMFFKDYLFRYSQKKLR